MDTSKFWKIDDFDGLELLKTKSSRRTHPRHWHDTYNIDVVVAGEHELEHGRFTHSAGPGCVFLFNPGEVHTSYLKRSHTVAHRTLYPTQRLMETLAREFKSKNCKLPVFSSPVVYDPELARLFRSAHMLYEMGKDSLRAQAMLLLAFSKAVERYSTEVCVLREAGREENAVDRAKNFIHETFSMKITLRDIAAVSGLSPFYFLRCFRRATGLSPFGFVINLRIEKAKGLLRSGWKIVDVAATTGFYDQSHFTNYFKSIVGVTPRHYKSAFEKRSSK